MNQLSPNRILQKGDEYRDNGSWKPVPAADFGLQIIFSKYTQVRRPGEEPSNNLPKPVKEEVKTSPITDVRRERQNPAPSRSGAGDALTPEINKAIPIEEIKLSPTDKLIAAAKANAEEFHTACMTPAPTTFGAPSAPDRPETVEVRKPEQMITIKFPSKARPCNWVGRNGCFPGHGIAMHATATDGICIIPVRKNGMHGNCYIEFPKSIIPQMVEWLNKQTTT